MSSRGVLVSDFLGYGLGKCSMGFVVLKSSEAGFITAGHCTQPAPYDGGSHNKVFYQPTQSGANRVGYETIDPEFSGSSPGCPAGAVCRRSDSAFINFDSDIDYNQGYIAKPTSLGSTLVEHDERFRVTEERNAVMVNDWVHRVGRTTGWKKGRIVGTCLPYQAIPSDEDTPQHLITCQNKYLVITYGGDSGGPVFTIPNSNYDDVRLNGIHWGGLPGGYSVYSPITRIYDDLGSHFSWKACAPVFNC